MNSLFDVTATTAVVTGSSRGIGLATARTLLSQGARVLINGYDPEGTRHAAQVLGQEFPALGDRQPHVAHLAGDRSPPGRVGPHPSSTCAAPSCPRRPPPATGSTSAAPDRSP